MLYPALEDSNVEVIFNQLHTDASHDYNLEEMHLDSLPWY